MHHSPNITAGVLVGGRSQRMGRPKALLSHPKAGTFVEHVVAVARQVASEVILVGSHASLPVSLCALPWLPDVHENRGPLAGLCSLLAVASDRWVLLLGCDLPLLGTSLLRRLAAHVSPTRDAVAFAYEDNSTATTGADARWHACCTLYHSRILPVAQRELIHGQGSLQRVLRTVQLATLQPDANEERLLTNVNTTEEHARFLALQNRPGLHTVQEPHGIKPVDAAAFLCPDWAS